MSYDYNNRNNSNNNNYTAILPLKLAYIINLLIMTEYYTI